MTKLIQIFKDIKSFLDTHTSSFMLEALYTPRIFINPGGIPKKDPQQGKGIPDSGSITIGIR